MESLKDYFITPAMWNMLVRHYLSYLEQNILNHQPVMDTPSVDVKPKITYCNGLYRSLELLWCRIPEEHKKSGLYLPYKVELPKEK